MKRLIQFMLDRKCKGSAPPPKALPELCAGCKIHPGTSELHACPYDEEINDDHTPCCDCCEACQQLCCEEI